MPAVSFSVKWPDGEKVEYYSPSTVIISRLDVGKAYPLKDFSNRAQESLCVASERVKEKFGYYCSAASAEQRKIQEKVTELSRKKIDGDVFVIAFTK